MDAALLLPDNLKRIADVVAKSNDIKRLERDISEVMQMFSDLSSLVSEQVRRPADPVQFTCDASCSAMPMA